MLEFFHDFVHDKEVFVGTIVITLLAGLAVWAFIDMRR